MLKLKGYLKPFIGMILVSLALLFSQAMCDLALPNYMADIVNTGIQRAGIETAAMSRMTDDAFIAISNVSEPDDAEVLMNCYTLSSDGIYIINEDVDTEVINRIITDAAQTLSVLSGSAENIDVKNIYALDFSDSARIDEARGETNRTPESVKEQTAVSYVLAFYKDAGVDTDKMRTDYLYKSGAVMLGISLIGVFAAIGVIFFSSRVGAKVAFDLRRDVFKKVASFSNAEFDKFSTASLITRTTNDINQVHFVVIMGMRLMCYAPIMGVGSIVMVLTRALDMSWILAIAVAAIVMMIVVIFLISMPKFKIIQKLIDKLNLVSRENLTGVMVTHAFGAEDFERTRFDEANTSLMKVNMFVNRVMIFMMPVMMLVMNMIMLLIVWVGAQKISAGTLMVGDMMAFLQYAMHVVLSFFFIAMMFIMVPRASVSGDRIYEVLSCEPSITDKDDASEINDDMRGVVEFENVSFRYDNATEDVLKDISFTARPGCTTAIIGATGSGKSTLINLIMRFYDVSQGCVKVGGVDVRELSQSQLRSQIGFVPQKGTLFSGTIESNLRYGDENASMEDIKNAARIAQASDFIEAKEEGYDSPVAQGGSNVSGGQRQRLSIARAILRRAPIYIFDDSFSALDFKTDAKLRHELKTGVSGATVIIVAQRVSTIMDADEILVLDEGRLVGIGTHDELMKSCTVYREIASSQLGMEAM